MVNKTPHRDPADYIVPITLGGLEGRMLHIPRSSKQSGASPRPAPEILFVYGHHSSLERWWGLMEVLAEYGSVTMPDLPGFGGMESFYKVGQKPTLDAMADYLAAFIKWRYKRKKVTIVGMSFGFVVATRMLQRYPELTSKVSMFVSLAGFAHEDDFALPRWRYNMILYGSRAFSHRPIAFLLRTLGLNPFVLGLVYKYSNHEKFRGAEADQFKKQLAAEVILWRINDVRTAGVTAAEFMKLDNCDRQINLPVFHIGVEGDHFFDNDLVEQHLRIIFTDYTLLATLNMKAHAPSVIATAEEAAAFIPDSMRQLLAKL